MSRFQHAAERLFEARTGSEKRDDFQQMLNARDDDR
jgi:hypothetical protein